MRAIRPLRFLASRPLWLVGFLLRQFRWFRATALASRRAIRDVATSMLPKGVSIATGFITSALIARGLGPSGLGMFAIVLSLSGLTSGLSDMGVGQTAIRYASRAAARGDTRRQFAILRWAFARRTALVLVIIAALFVAAPTLATEVWHHAELTPLLRLGLFTAIFTALAAAPTYYFQSSRRFGMNALVQTGQQIITFTGILALSWLNRWSVSLVVGVGLLSTAIGALAFLALVPKAALWPDVDANDERRGILARFWRAPADVAERPSETGDVSVETFAAYSVLATLISLVITRVDVWLMAALLPSSDVGLYNAAMRFTLPLLVLQTSYMTALSPRVAAVTTARDTIALLKAVFRISALLALGALVYALAAPSLAPWLFGEAYRASVLTGHLLCIHYALIILSRPLSVIGYNFGFVRYYWAISLFQLGLLVVLNLWLLPLYGPAAAAGAWIAADLVGFVLVAGMLARKIAALGQR